MNESLFVEDFTTLKASFSGPMWRIASIVEDYYSLAFRRGLDGLNRALAVLLDGNADYSDTGYEFRNGLECAAWLIRAQDRGGRGVRAY